MFKQDGSLMHLSCIQEAKCGSALSCPFTKVNDHPNQDCLFVSLHFKGKCLERYDDDIIGTKLSSTPYQIIPIIFTIVAKDRF
jgi:hypothetical protein